MYCTHSEFIEVPHDIFWTTWINVNDWHAWDLSICSAHAYGENPSGFSGKFIFMKGQIRRFHFTQYEPGCGYSFDIHTLFSVIHCSRSLTPVINGVIVTHECSSEGFTLLPSVCRNLMKRYLRQSLIKLKHYTEENYRRSFISRIGNSCASAGLFTRLSCTG